MQIKWDTRQRSFMFLSHIRERNGSQPFVPYAWFSRTGRKVKGSREKSNQCMMSHMNYKYNINVTYARSLLMVCVHYASHMYPHGTCKMVGAPAHRVTHSTDAICILLERDMAAFCKAKLIAVHSALQANRLDASVCSYSCNRLPNSRRPKAFLIVFLSLHRLTEMTIIITFAYF